MRRRKETFFRPHRRTPHFKRQSRRGTKDASPIKFMGETLAAKEKVRQKSRSPKKEDFARHRRVYSKGKRSRSATMTQ